MEREELLDKAKSWIDNYQINILPVIKSNCCYSPSDVSYLCDQVGDLTLFILYYDTIQDKTGEEKSILSLLEKASEEMHAIFMEKDKEFEELNSAPIVTFDDEPSSELC